jgi:hypothetical protein
VDFESDRLLETSALSPRAAIADETEASKANQHHRPGGRFGDASDSQTGEAPLKAKEGVVHAIRVHDVPGNLARRIVRNRKRALTGAVSRIRSVERDERSQRASQKTVRRITRVEVTSDDLPSLLILLASVPSPALAPAPGTSKVEMAPYLSRT